MFNKCDASWHYFVSVRNLILTSWVWAAHFVPTLWHFLDSLPLALSSLIIPCSGGRLDNSLSWFVGNLVSTYTISDSSRDFFRNITPVSKDLSVEARLGLQLSPWWCPVGVRPAADTLLRHPRPRSSWTETLWAFPPSRWPRMARVHSRATSPPHTAAVPGGEGATVSCLSVSLSVSLSKRVSLSVDFVSQSWAETRRTVFL